MLDSGVTAVMVGMEVLEVGVNTVIKAAMSEGMSQFVFSVYSPAMGVIVLFLASSILNSCSLQLSSATGIGLSSPTLSSAMTDLTPAFTFLLAVISRMEKLDLRLRSSQAKSIGTFASIAGALVVTLYKGQAIINPNQQNFLAMQSDWVTGGIFCAASAILLSLLFIVQAWIARDYPEEQMIILISYTFVTILSIIVTLFVEKDPSAWKLRPDKGLIAIVSSAVFGVAIRNVIHVWAIRKKGPVYISIFKPLGMVIAMVMGCLFLGDTLYIGRVTGGVVIAVGFYAVLWGKAQEEMRSKRVEWSSTDKAPLLQNKEEEDV